MRDRGERTEFLFIIIIPIGLVFSAVEALCLSKFDHERSTGVAGGNYQTAISTKVLEISLEIMVYAFEEDGILNKTWKTFFDHLIS